MEKEELLEEYESGDLDDPNRLQQVRDAIREHAGLIVPRRMGEIRDWWSRNKSVVARRLREEDEDGDVSGADDEDASTDGEESATAENDETAFSTIDADDPDQEE